MVVQVPLVQPIKRYKMVIFQKLTSFTSDPKDTSNANGDNDDSAWGNHLDALGDKLNSEGDRTGFLRMVNRNSRLNGSSYSLSSLFSVGSVGGANSVVTAASSRHGGSTRLAPQSLTSLLQVAL